MELKKIDRLTEITTFQLRAARAGLKMSLKELSEVSGISVKTLFSLESGYIFEPPEKSRLITLLKVKNVYEYNGVEFFENNILKLTNPKSKMQFKFSKKTNHKES